MTASNATPTQSTNKHQADAHYRWWIIAGLILVCVALYGRTVQYDFISYDDPSYITQNHLIQQGLTSEGIRSAFTTPHSYNWHPLTTLSHLLDCELFGAEEAGGHHAVNLLFHATATVVLFVVLHQMTGSLWPSALVAALFAVHPLGVESVAWVSERKNVLSTFLWFVTMGAYLHYVRLPNLSRYLLVVVSLALGMMAKQMLVTLPCVLLLIDYWPLRRIRFEENPRNRVQPPQTSLSWLIAEKVPFLGISLAGSALVLWAQGHTQMSLDSLPLMARIENTLISYVAYLGQFIWPVNLLVYYPLRTANMPPEDMTGALLPQAVLSALVLIAVSLLCLRTWRTRPYLIVGWLWYLGTLVPVIGIVQVGNQSMADRYTYVPLVGIYIMIAWTAAEFVARREAARPWVVGAVAISLVVFSALTFKQVGYWKDSTTLFTYVLEVNEANAVAQHAIAESLYEDKKFEQAEHHIRRAIELRPTEPRPYVSLGYVYYRQRKFEQALETFNRGIAIDPSSSFAYNGRGLVFLSAGDFAKAQADIQRALDLNPHNVNALLNMQLVLGQSALQDGNLDQAETHFRKAAELDDEEETAWVFLGMIAATQGHTAEALQHYRQALNQNPDSIEANINLANLLITAPDMAMRNPAEAIRFADHACQETNYNRPDLLNTLAAAYYSAGRNEEAVQVAEHALKIPGLTPALRDQMTQNLKLFRAPPSNERP